MILCCGEALIDMLPRTLADGEAVFLPVPGGAVFNTAIGLGRLGIETGFFCPLSTDLFGNQLLDALAESDVDASLCPRVSRPTTLAFVSLDKGQARYHFMDEKSALRALAAAECPVLSTPPQAAFFGGISLASPPAATHFEAMMADWAGRSILMLDPNVRPDFIDDPTAYRARIDRMLGHADIVKLSDEDFHWLFGDARIEDVAARLHRGGTSIVLFTRGAQPARAYAPSGWVEMPAPDVAVVDTVGAGDTFNAGFLAGLSLAGLLDRTAWPNVTAEAIRRALRLAVGVAAVTVSRAGANPPHRADIADLLAASAR